MSRRPAALVATLAVVAVGALGPGIVAATPPPADPAAPPPTDAAAPPPTDAAAPPPTDPVAPPPTAAADTSFLRGEAERQFAEANAGATQVACAVPPADEPGVLFNCYGVGGDGTVLAMVATMNDDGGIEFSALAADAGAPPDTASAPEPSSGTGNAVVPVAPPVGPSIVAVTHDGSGDFAIQPQNAGATIGAPVARATGAFSGRFLVVFTSPVTDFAVTADGNWTFELVPATEAPLFDVAAPVTGDAPTVLATDIESELQVTVDAEGAGPVIVTTFTAAGQQTLVDESAPFTGELTLPAGRGYLGIEASGPWTLTPAGTAAPPASAVG